MKRLLKKISSEFRIVSTDYGFFEHKLLTNTISIYRCHKLQLKLFGMFWITVDELWRLDISN